MSKHHSPLLGYNNNVRHKGRVFHIQTEDSGVKHPHVITHIFMDGGRILKSTKTSYAEHVGNDGLQDTVRKMMKDQHKAMFVALRDGQLDHLIPPSGASMPPPPPDVAPPPKKASVPPPKPGAKGKSVPPPPPGSMRPAAPDLPPISDAAPMTLREPHTELTLDDLDGLAKPGIAHQPTDLPPPPSNIFREHKPEPGTGGRYRTLRDPRMDPDSSSEMLAAPKVDHTDPVPPSRIDRVELKPPSRKSERPPRSERPAARRVDSPAATERTGPKSSRSPKPGEAGPEPKKKRSSRPPRSQQGEGRYAPARPAAIFGPAKPSTGQQSSIFGEDLISDKSLDEVILSYLAEDLEGEK